MYATAALRVRVPIPDDCTNSNLDCTTSADRLWEFEGMTVRTARPTRPCHPVL